ncbi:MAG TPA: CBS domain-containing protein [Planctomycetota bacterium]
MYVRNWMSSPAVTIPPAASAAAAMEVMTGRKVRRLPVVEGWGLRGIVTLSDLHADRRPDASVEDVMTSDPLTVVPDDTLESAAKIMLERQVSGLPVLDAERRVAGIITESDVFRALCDLLGVKEKGARVVFTVPEDSDLLESLRHRLGGMVPRSLATFHNTARGCWEVVTRVRGRAPALKR